MPILASGAAPAYVSSTLGDGAVLGSWTHSTSPSDGNVNDLLIVFGGMDRTAGGSLWTEAGWTERLDQNARPSLMVATKVDASGSDAVSGTNSPAAVGHTQMARYRFATYDTIGAVATLSGSGTLNVPSITSAGGEVLLWVYSEDEGATIPTPSGWTLIRQDNSLSSGTSSLFRKVVVPGATGVVSVSVTATGTCGGVLVGIK